MLQNLFLSGKTCHGCIEAIVALVPSLDSKNTFSCSCSIDLYMIQKIVLSVVREKNCCAVISYWTDVVCPCQASKSFCLAFFFVA